MISVLLILLGFASHPSRQVENPDLRLTVKITGIKGYCASEPDFHQLNVGLELTFTNRGSGVVIL